MISALGLPTDVTREIVEAATLAPSLHNSQPWRFRLEGDRIELHADLDRRIAVADPDDRELRIACGAALLNLRLALLSHHIRPLVTVEPATAAPLLATVRNGGPVGPAEGDGALFRAIRNRHTNRKPFLDQPVPAEYGLRLVRAATSEHCMLKVVGDPAAQEELRKLVAAAYRRQTADPAWLAEFTAWVARPYADREGVPLLSSGPDPESQDIWVLRDFSAGHAAARRPGKDFESEPLLAVLATYVDDPPDQVQAGEALQRVLLTATDLGLSASFLSQVVEVPSTRSDLRHLLGGLLHPQAVIRIGYGSPVPRVPRRSVEACLVGVDGTTWEPRAD